jgi:hypothetical protein
MEAFRNSDAKLAVFEHDPVKHRGRSQPGPRTAEILSHAAPSASHPSPDPEPQRVGTFEHPHPIARASLLSNYENPWSRMLYQAIAKISVLVRRLWDSLAVDELAGGDHRRGRAGATPGGA